MNALQKIFLLGILAAAVLTGCDRNYKFETAKWMSGDGLEYPMRGRLVNDLLENYKLKGMTYKQIQHLLGDPQGSDAGDIYYTIENTYNYKGEHKTLKNLVLDMGKDSIITKAYIYELKPKNK